MPAPRRPRKQRGAIDRDKVVRAALKLLEREGIAGVSTRHLAHALGISGPSLYWHFKDKRELFDHMAEAILAEAQAKRDPLYHEKNWRIWLMKAGSAYRRAASSRRDAAQLLAGARPTGKHPRLNYDAMVARLRREGFSERDSPYIVWAVARFALGWTVREAGADLMPRAESQKAFEFALAALIDGFAKHRRKRSS